MLVLLFLVALSPYILPFCLLLVPFIFCHGLSRALTSHMYVLAGRNPSSVVAYPPQPLWFVGRGRWEYVGYSEIPLYGDINLLSSFWAPTFTAEWVAYSTLPSRWDKLIRFPLVVRWGRWRWGFLLFSIPNTMAVTRTDLIWCHCGTSSQLHPLLGRGYPMWRNSSDKVLDIICLEKLLNCSALKSH